MKRLTLGCLSPLALAVLGVGTQAQAQEPAAADSIFSLSGFATAGAVGTNSDEALYVVSGQPRGASKSWSGGVDTKLGVQVNAKLNQMFSATMQVLSKQNGDGSYKPEIEWAFAKAQFSPALSIRLGRMGAPFFAVSDFRDVGYANTWLRPPQDVYGQVPVSHFDGGDVNYQTNLGSATANLQVFAGKSKSVFEGVDVSMDNMIGFSASVELDGGITLRAGYVDAKLTVASASLNQLVGILRKVPVPGAAAAGNQMDATDKKATFTGFGVTLDRDNWLAMAEYTMRRTDSYVPDTDGWYVTLGYRLGKFTPYVTISDLSQKSRNVDNNIPAGVPIPGLTADLKGLVDGTLRSQSNQQKTNAVGVRWDAYRNVAVKGQYEQIKADGPGLFSSPSAAFIAGKNTVNVYSVAVDFVF
ncbi:porin [Roseateles oligotrophus]|uniref:Porin n=1 Tax=Roseateles oligotrophus TaxID=1769250 RepID=A0ABT2YE48_9BURK|nr:porin [Roseateles oligotrophus]MCV2368307.1 porin [Roseateles oligotrophus]